MIRQFRPKKPQYRPGRNDRVGFAETHPDFIPGVHILLLTGHRNGIVLPIGSAVIVGQYIAATAAHVVQEFYNELQEGEVVFTGRNRFLGMLSALKNPKFHITASLVDKQHPTGIHFVVDISNISLLSDIAVLQLRRDPDAPDFTFKIPPMNACPPFIGSLIEAYGYAAGAEDDSSVIEAGFYATRGEVTDLLPSGRDQATLWFPVFQTSAHFAGGMSGGPVFNQQGELCGLVCYDAGDDMDNPDAAPISYAVMLYPLLACLVELSLPGEPPTTPYTIQNLCVRGIVAMRHSEKFEFGIDANGWATEMRGPPALS